MLVKVMDINSKRSRYINPNNVVEVNPPEVEDYEEQTALYSTVVLNNGTTIRVAEPVSSLVARLNQAA